MMNRSLRIERVYSLGDYRSIRFSDDILDLPEEVVFNQPLVDKIRLLQLINVEINFRQYKDLISKVNTYSEEEALAFLEEQKINTLDEIKDILESKRKGE